MKTNSAARLACIKQMVADGLNADELEAMTDREVQDRFNIWFHHRNIRRTRLDSADAAHLSTPLAQKDSAMFNRDEAIETIARRCPNSDTSSRSFLATKSDEYLATRLAVLNHNAETEATEDAYQRSKANLNANHPSRLDSPRDHAARGDEAERRYDAVEAEVDYQRSKARVNDGHPSMQHHRDSRGAHDRADRGNSSTDFRSDAEAAEDAYQRSKAALNANHPSMRNDRAPTNVGGAEVGVRWVR